MKHPLAASGLAVKRSSARAMAGSTPALALGGPPKAWMVVADWCNLLAGIFLMCAFLEGALIHSSKMDSLLVDGAPSANALNCLQIFLSLEGSLFAVSSFFRIGIMAMTPPEMGGGATGCMRFTILMAGGIFFALSGLGFPGCITNVTYIFNKSSCTHPAAGNTPYVWNAMAHFGITCFMVGSAIGFKGVLRAPKDKLVSPFWGCAMNAVGAWTIGIFKVWGPVFLGGLDNHQNLPTFDFTAPAAAESWSWTWWVAFTGSFCLTLGACIFLIMNRSYALVAN